jgi:ABC-type multidrug transport system ATPase subunit
MQLTVEGVGKRFRGSVWALRDVSLELGPGLLCLLGPNRAGKTTLMSIIATVSRPSLGRVLWDGVDTAKRPNQLRAVLGYLPQDFGLYPSLTVVELLEYLAAIKGLRRSVARSRIEELLHLVNLFEARERRLADYSGGMKQRVGIAQALLNDPQVLLADEPTIRLDPGERIRFLGLLADLARDRIVVLSTRSVTDAEMTASRIAVLDRGRLLAHARPEELLEQTEGQVWQWQVPASEMPEIEKRHLVSSATRQGDRVMVRAVAASLPEDAARLVQPRLEDAYLSLLGARPRGSTL